MAYALKYSGELLDHYCRVIRVEILENDFTGVSEEVKLQGITKTYNGSDSDLYVQRIGSAVSVGMLSPIDFKFIDLFTADSRKFRMRLYIDGLQHWSGWITPDLFTEPYGCAPYITTVTATDGLGNLDALDFTGIAGNESVTYAYLLAVILSRVNDLYTNLAVNIFEENQSTDSSPLFQTVVDINRYKGLTYSDILTDILTVWGARIFQHNAEWWVVNVNEFNTDLQVTKIDYFGEEVETFAVSPDILVSKEQDNKFATVDQQLNILPAWKQFEVNKDLGLRDSIPQNHDFTEWEITGYKTRIDIETGRQTQVPIYKPLNWIFSERQVGGYPAPWVSRSTDANLDVIVLSGETSTPAPTYEMTQKLGVFVEGYQNLRFRLNYGLSCFTDNAQGQIWIKIKMGLYFLTVEGEWTLTDTYINLQNIPAANKYNSSVNFTDYELLSILLPPNGGELSVRVYQPFPTLNASQMSLHINECDIDLITGDVTDYPEDLDYTYVVNEQNNFVNDDVEILTGDLPDYGNESETPSVDILNEKFVYSGGMFLDIAQTQPTQKWLSKRDIDNGNTFIKNLDKVVCDLKAEFTNLPQWAISGSLLTKDISILNNIVDFNINSNKYLCCNGTYDMRNSIFNGTFIQVGVKADITEWILADGTWVDKNVWIDSDYWNDNNDNVVLVEVSGLGYHDIGYLFTSGDTIETFPLPIPQKNIFLYDDSAVIISVPHIYSGNGLQFVPDPTATVSFNNSFNATISGISKTIKIIVTL